MQWAKKFNKTNTQNGFSICAAKCKNAATIEEGIY